MKNYLYYIKYLLYFCVPIIRITLEYLIYFCVIIICFTSE